MLYCKVVEKLPFLKGEKRVDFLKEKKIECWNKILKISTYN